MISAANSLIFIDFSNTTQLTFIDLLFCQFCWLAILTLLNCNFLFIWLDCDLGPSPIIIHATCLCFLLFWLWLSYFEGCFFAYFSFLVQPIHCFIHMAEKSFDLANHFLFLLCGLRWSKQHMIAFLNLLFHNLNAADGICDGVLDRLCCCYRRFLLFLLLWHRLLSLLFYDLLDLYDFLDDLFDGNFDHFLDFNDFLYFDLHLFFHYLFLNLNLDNLFWHHFCEVFQQRISLLF